MNWSERDLQHLQARRNPPKRKARGSVGAAIRASFFIPVAVPTKKNGKMAVNGRVVIPAKKRAILDEITKAARLFWGCRPPLTQVVISSVFYTLNLNQDDDGSATSLMDSLVQARVIQNDCRAHVLRQRASWKLIEAGESEGVMVRIYGHAYLEAA